MTKRSADDASLADELNNDKRQRLSKTSTDELEYKMVTINGDSAKFLVSDLMKIEFFAMRFSSNWNKNEAERQCVIEGDYIPWGIVELRMAVAYLSSKRLHGLCDANLLKNSDDVLVKFLQCLDFFCLKFDEDALTKYYESTTHEAITISDLHRLQSYKHPLLTQFSVDCLQNVYTLCMGKTVDRIQDNIRKFKVDIGSSFVIKEDNAQDWIAHKMQEYCVFKKQLCRDWLFVSDALHKVLQDMFVRRDLFQCMINAKEIIEQFVCFHSISSSHKLSSHMHFGPVHNHHVHSYHRHHAYVHGNQLHMHHTLNSAGHHNSASPVKSKHILNDVKIETFPVFQCLIMLKFFLRNFDAILAAPQRYNRYRGGGSGGIYCHHDVPGNGIEIDLLTWRQIIVKQTVDWIMLLPSILQCRIFTEKGSDPQYEHSCRQHDIQFVNLVFKQQRKQQQQQPNNSSSSTSTEPQEEDMTAFLKRTLMQIYKELIKEILHIQQEQQHRPQCAELVEISVIETLVIPCIESTSLYTDDTWILHIMQTARQKEAILLASKLKMLMLDLQLNGEPIDFAYQEQIELYLSS